MHQTFAVHGWIKSRTLCHRILRDSITLWRKISEGTGSDPLDFTAHLIKVCLSDIVSVYHSPPRLEGTASVMVAL